MNTDVANWVTGDVSRVSLAVVTVDQQRFTATPVRWIKKFKEKLKGEQGEPGPPGPQGPPGADGEAGLPGTSGGGVLATKSDTYSVVTDFIEMTSTSTFTSIAECADADDILINGGCVIGGPAFVNGRILQNFPQSGGPTGNDQHECRATSIAAGGGLFLRARAVCLSVP